MAHPEQQHFLKTVRDKFPEKFVDCDVLDIGSLDLNGNCRFLFSGNYKYTGVDIGMGPNVDIVSLGHEYKRDVPFDVVISCEAFEHDQFWSLTIQNCINLTKSGGIFLFSCATTGRQEHGTSRTTPQDSPFTFTEFNDYYKNLTEQDIREVVALGVEFSDHRFDVNNHTKDLYFWGIKK